VEYGEVCGIFECVLRGDNGFGYDLILCVDEFCMFVEYINVEKYVISYCGWVLCAIVLYVVDVFVVG